MSKASGEFFAFVDSDDLWRPTFLSTLHRLLEAQPSAALGFCQIVVIDLDDKILKTRDTGLPPEPREGVLHNPFEKILRHMPFQTSGVMLRRSVIQEIGGFDLTLPVGEDWDLWYRIARKYDFVYTLEELACNRVHNHNLPKSDSTALACNVRLNLRHLPYVDDSGSRQLLQARVSRQILLLQEQLMREGAAANGYAPLLTHALAPQSMRYRVGSLMRHMPKFVGKAFAGMIRRIGEQSRST